MSYSNSNQEGFKLTKDNSESRNILTGQKKDGLYDFKGFKMIEIYEVQCIIAPK
jgi:hypothetical protein